MKLLLYILGFSIAFSNCGGEKTTVSEMANKEYIHELIPGTETELLILKDPQGNTMEKGMMRNGRKEGLWTYNYSGVEYPEKLISYVNGMYNGLYLELNEREQIELMAHYKNNILHGPWAKIRNGKTQISVNYKDGKMDGLFQEFKNGQIKKEISFTNGKENGFMYYYDMEGNVTLKYEFKDGVKINGGIEKNTAAESK